MRCYIRQENIGVVWDEGADEDFMGVGGWGLGVGVGGGGLGVARQCLKRAHATDELETWQKSRILQQQRQHQAADASVKTAVTVKMREVSTRRPLCPRLQDLLLFNTLSLLNKPLMRR